MSEGYWHSLDSIKFQQVPRNSFVHSPTLYFPLRFYAIHRRVLKMCHVPKSGSSYARSYKETTLLTVG